MKKGLMFLFGILSFLGINTVSAEEIYLNYEDNINEIKPYIDEIGYDQINIAINDTIKYHDVNLSEDYPYYFISLYYHGVYQKFMVVITSLSSNYADEMSWNFDQSGDSSYLINNTYMDYTQFYYDFSDNTIKPYGSYNNDFYLFSVDLETNPYYPYNYYYSNFDFYYKGTLLGDNTLSYLSPSDTLYIQNLENSSSYFKYQANTDFLIEPYYLYDNNDSFVEETYIEINLNEHSYVALSLKDYNTIPESNFSTYTNMYIKGQVCITPVYNYGLTERKDILTGTQIEGCSVYYPDFTLDKMYILRDDVKNHAIYYLKPYDTTKENIVKIDSSKFNITYISEVNASNPQVEVNGKVYPTIPYDELTDTSTKSEEEGYVPGVSCSFGDFNCYNQYNPENLFDEVFSSPLELLESVWSAISTVFSLIGEFISLLPVPMQTFLYLSFMIAVVLGLLKIIL